MWTYISVLTFILAFCSIANFAKGDIPDWYWNISDRTNCSLIPKNLAIPGQVSDMIDKGNRIIIFHIEITGCLGPLTGEYPGNLFDKKTWTLITEKTGRSMLNFPDEYVEKSLYTLSFGRKSVNVALDQNPPNCFNETYTLDQILNTIRFYVLRNFSENGGMVSDNIEVCNRKVFLTDNNTKAELFYVCCNEGDDTCGIVTKGPWMKRLDNFLNFIKYTLPFFLPFMIPKRMFHARPANAAYRYTFRAEDSTKFNVDKIATESLMNSSEYTRTDIRLPSFQEFMREQETGRHNLRINSLFLDVPTDKLIDERYSQLSRISRFFFKTFVKYEVTDKDSSLSQCCNDSPFKLCLDVSWLQCCKDNCRNFSWSVCLKFITIPLFFLIIISPWLVKVILYRLSDLTIYDRVKDIEYTLNIHVHNIENPALTIEFEAGCIIMFLLLFVSYHASPICRISLKKIILSLISVEQGFDIKKTISMLIELLVFPFKEWGIVGIILFPVSAVIFSLLFGCCILKALPFVTVYYTYFSYTLILVCHFFTHYLNFNCLQECQIMKGLIALVRRLLVLLRPNVKKYNIFDNSSKSISYITLIIYFMFLCPYIGLFSFSIITMIVVFYIDCLSFVIMGVFLNFKDVNPYICFGLLIAVYIRSCFHSVQKRYEHFLKLLVKKVQSKVFDQLGNLKDMTSDEKVAISIQSRYHSSENFPRFVFLHKKKYLAWEAKRLLFFLDRLENVPKLNLSKKVFQDMNTEGNLAFPGPEYMLYLKAVRDLLVVFIFLVYVVIMVFAIDKAHDLSSGVQIMIALSGGAVPFVLEKFIFRTHKTDQSENILTEKMLENEIENFKEEWKVTDMQVSSSDNFNIQETLVKQVYSEPEEPDFIILDDEDSTILVRNSIVSSENDEEQFNSEDTDSHHLCEIRYVHNYEALS